MTPRRPNKVLYYAAYLLVYPLLKLLFRLKVDRSGYQAASGPFIVLCNHESFMDFLLPTLAIFPHLLNAVAAQKFFYYRPLHILLPLLGCIPKKLFDSDMRTIAGILTVLKRGDNILLFVEGRCTTAGSYMGMHKATGKLLKKAGVPVISCRIEGAYTCMPFWRKGFRLGKVCLTVANLLSPDDLETLSVDEINERVDMRLSGRDALEGAGVCDGAGVLKSADLVATKGALRPGGTTKGKPLSTLFERRLIEGLENILYYCTNCGSEFTLTTKGNTIRCANCNNTASLNRFARLIAAPGSAVPATIQDWQRAQNLYELQHLGENMEPISVEVTVRVPADKPGRGMKPGGSGVLTFTPQGWSFEGEILQEPASLFFPLKTVPALTFDPNDNFQIYSGGVLYLFTPLDAQACAKYATLGECAYWRFMPEVQMTPGVNNGLIKR